MKLMRFVVLMMLFLCSSNLLAQRIVKNSKDAEYEYYSSTTIGFMQGGGSLVGVDFEYWIYKNFGVQVGGGFVGFGAGLNYHYKPTLRSSFLSIQYWHQVFQNSYTQSLVGPAFVFRAKKLLSLQLGLGFRIEEGPALPESLKKAPIMLTYAIGFYFPR